MSSHQDNLSPDTHVVVVWDAARLSQDEKRQTKSLGRFLNISGKMVVLQTSKWDWPELCDIQIKHDPRFSRVFPYEDLPAPWLNGVEPQWLIRWNGLPGTVAVGTIEGAGMTGAERILWAKEPGTTVMALVPTVSRNGRIVFAQLDIQHRLDRSQSDYDPAAERVLSNLLRAVAQ